MYFWCFLLFLCTFVQSKKRKFVAFVSCSRPGRRTRRIARQRTYRERCGFFRFVWDVKCVFGEIFFISKPREISNVHQPPAMVRDEIASYRRQRPAARHVAGKTRFPSGKRFRLENSISMSYSYCDMKRSNTRIRVSWSSVYVTRRNKRDTFVSFPGLLTVGTLSKMFV